MATNYGNLSLSELIVYNNTTGTPGSLTFDTNNDGNFNMNTGLDLTGNVNNYFKIDPNNSIIYLVTSSGNVNIQSNADLSLVGSSINLASNNTYFTGLVTGSIDMSNPDGTSFGSLSYGTNINSTTDFCMNTGLFLNGGLTFTDVSSGYPYATINQSGYNISMNAGLDLNGNEDVSGNLTLDGSLTISNSTSSGILTLNSNNNFVMNTGLVVDGTISAAESINVSNGNINVSNGTISASGNISGSEFKIGSYVLGINSSNNFAINTGLNVTGTNNITLDGSLNFVNNNNYGIIFSDNSTLNSTGKIAFINESNTFTKVNTFDNGLDINGNITVDASLNFQNGYGITFTDGSTLTSASGAGTGGASLSGANNFTALNTFEAGLDISGNLVFTQQTSNSTAEQFTGIQLNYSNQGSYLCFPYANTNGSTMITNAFSPPSGTSPQGLGIIWDNSSTQGEVDLIGYGGGSSSSGGVSIYSYNTGSGEKCIADFWPNGSTIYTGLDVNGSISVGNTLSFNGTYGSYNYGIQFGSNNNSILSFPLTFPNTATEVPGLSLFWNASNASAEMDFICQGNTTIGGLNIYGTGGSNASPILLASFLGTGLQSTIYTPLDVKGNITVDGSLNFQNGYGITFSDGSTLTSASGSGSGGASLSGANNFTALNTFEAGLDISGALIFTQDASGSSQQYTGIQLNGGYGGYLSFPYNTNGGVSNALSPYSTFGAAAIAAGESWNSPGGLGITWSHLGYGETDLIGYGGGNYNDGGITIYGYNTNNNSIGQPQGDVATRIADFWPTGSTIYNNLTVNNGSINSNGITTKIITASELSQYYSNTTYITVFMYSGSFGMINIQGYNGTYYGSCTNYYSVSQDGYIGLGSNASGNTSTGSFQLAPTAKNSTTSYPALIQYNALFPTTCGDVYITIFGTLCSSIVVTNSAVS